MDIPAKNALNEINSRSNHKMKLSVTRANRDRQRERYKDREKGTENKGRNKKN